MVSEPGADQMSKDEAMSFLKSATEDVNLSEQVYNTHFLDDNTKQPLSFVTKEQMHVCTLNYLTQFEKDKAKDQYEAAKQLY